MVGAGSRGSCSYVVWEVATGRELFRWPWPERAFKGPVVFSPDGGTLASPMTDGSILFWDLSHARARLGP
jgi:WD40 repeat protein